MDNIAAARTVVASTQFHINYNRKEALMAVKPLQFTVGPSAGFVKTKEQAEGALKTGASIIVLGSYTLEERPGNPGPNLYADRDDHHLLSGSLNSYGLPNLGIEYLRSWLPDFMKRAKELGVKVRVSIAAFSVEEFLKSVRVLSEFYDGDIELNLGCPNVWHGTVQHRIMSFDLETMQSVVAGCRVYVGPERLGAKLSPYSDPWMIGQAWEVLMGSQIATIVTMNTFANAVIYDPETAKALIDVPNGYAGYAGDGSLPMALGQVRQLANLRHEAMRRETLKHVVRIEGVGGVSSGYAAHQMYMAGADGVLSGTAYGRDRKVIARIYEEMPEGLQNLALAA